MMQAIGTESVFSADEYFQQDLKYKHTFIPFKKHERSTVFTAPQRCPVGESEIGVTETIGEKGVGS